MKYIESTFTNAKFIMFATTPEWNKANYTNYTTVGFPVRIKDGDGYKMIKMVDVDSPNYDDVAFDLRVGSKVTCDLWTYGEMEFVGHVLASGKRSKVKGFKTPIARRYGEDKRTLEGALPVYFRDKTIK